MGFQYEILESDWENDSNFIEVTYGVNDEYALSNIFYRHSLVISIDRGFGEGIDPETVELLMKSKRKIRIWISPSSHRYYERFQVWSEETVNFQEMCEALKGKELYIVEVPEAKYIQDNQESNLYNYCMSFVSPDELLHIDSAIIQKKHLHPSNVFGLDLMYYKLSEPDKKYPLIGNEYRQIYLCGNAYNYEVIVHEPVNPDQKFLGLRFEKYLTDCDGINIGVRYILAAPKSRTNRMTSMYVSGGQYVYSRSELKLTEAQIYGAEPIYIDLYLNDTDSHYTVTQEWKERETSVSELYLKTLVVFPNDDL